MSPNETSDGRLLDLLHAQGSMTIAELSAACEVTATAIRQRLHRLMGEGLVERTLRRTGRGRPGHSYSLTEKARRRAGTNFRDLALVLWDEIRAVKDQQVRAGLLRRLAVKMAAMYRVRTGGASQPERMESVKELFDERRVAVEIDPSGEAPVLRILDCPYPDLAEKDRGICAMEKMVLGELIGGPLRLATCRLDGYACCEFEGEATSVATGVVAAN